ncbi:predicted protein [Histoplasma capsulatum G186AR]|uniref:Uncharacterized protein n=1 Tax=Ajellomyces capsulatus (strain G186AR / H82 / ATCC MYA-2454 / RMSCC 2432) TaxID=447093 RepID=C0NQW6_AJECG|nr:uncharacterized protein HCBG_05396 [Histoplasma capsulatum G186AR]EEH06080.1 predicted protein [Histoplasma capsulatum G186AR]
MPGFALQDEGAFAEDTLIELSNICAPPCKPYHDLPNHSTLPAGVKLAYTLYAFAVMCRDIRVGNGKTPFLGGIHHRIACQDDLEISHLGTRVRSGRHPLDMIEPMNMTNNLGKGVRVDWDFRQKKICKVEMKLWTCTAAYLMIRMERNLSTIRKNAVSGWLIVV